MTVSEPGESTGIVEHAFKGLEVDDAGFSAAVDLKLTFRIRLRRVVLCAASVLGLALFLQQLDAGRSLFGGVLAPLISNGSMSYALSIADWVATLALVFVVTAVPISTLFTVVLVLRARSGSSILARKSAR